MSYTLLGADGKPYQSDVKGQWGGHRGTRIYGRLDCPSALRAIANGGYVRNRVFFADEATAVTAGYRPCAVCCPDRYRTWKASARSAMPDDSKGTFTVAPAAVNVPSRTRSRRRGSGVRPRG